MPGEATCTKTLSDSLLQLGWRLSWLCVSPVPGLRLAADCRVFILRDREMWSFRTSRAFFRKLQFSFETKPQKSDSQEIHNPAWDCVFLFGKKKKYELFWLPKWLSTILMWQPLTLHLWYRACSLKIKKERKNLFSKPWHLPGGYHTRSRAAKSKTVITVWDGWWSLFIQQVFLGCLHCAWCWNYGDVQIQGR